MANVLYPMPAGVNENNRRDILAVEAASIADNGAVTITVPAEYIGRASMPNVKGIWTYGAGAVGARTATFMPIVDVGSALVGWEVVSYVETTGVLTLTNRSGGAQSNIYILFEMIDDVNPA